MFVFRACMSAKHLGQIGQSILIKIHEGHGWLRQARHNCFWHYSVFTF